MVGRQTSNDFGMYSWIDALADGKDQGMLVNAETGEGVSALRTHCCAEVLDAPLRSTT